MIKFSCKKCGQKLNVEDKHSGKRVKCPKCGSVSVVPDNSDKIKFHCKNCGQGISVPQIHAGKKGKCPKCKNPVVIPSLKKETSESAIHRPSIPSETDEDQYEEESDVSEEGTGLDRRLILAVSGIAAVVVVGLIILIIVILPSGPKHIEESSMTPRQEVADTDLRPQPVTPDTQPTEPIVEEYQKEEILPALQYKLRFEKGQSYYVRVISDSNSVQEVNGQQSVSEVTTGFGYSFDVNEVDEKGNGWVDCTVDWIKLMRKAPMIDVTYDSSEKTSRVPPLAQSVAMYLGESFSAKMTPQGQVEELRGLEKLHRNIEKKMPKGRTEQQILQNLDSKELANSIKNMFLSPMAVYPDKPVRIGDSWSRTGFLTGLESFILVSKWTLQHRKAGIAIIQASASIKSQPDAVQRQEVKVKYDMSGKQTGQIKIKESTGQIIFSKLNQDLSGQAQADDTAIRSKTYAVTTFEMIKRD
jgi:DNA-directed RNA polymerase subunit RPC12/RpoP